MRYLLGLSKLVPRSLGNQEVMQQEHCREKAEWINRVVFWMANSASTPCQILSQQDQTYLHLLSMWNELPPEYVDSQIPHAGWAHSRGREPPSSSPPSPRQRQTALVSLQSRRLGNPTINKLSTAINGRLQLAGRLTVHPMTACMCCLREPPL